MSTPDRHGLRRARNQCERRRKSHIAARPRPASVREDGSGTNVMSKPGTCDKAKPNTVEGGGLSPPRTKLFPTVDEPMNIGTRGAPLFQLASDHVYPAFADHPRTTKSTVLPGEKPWPSPVVTSRLFRVMMRPSTLEWFVLFPATI